MDREDFRRLSDLFEHVCNLPDDERQVFLDEACCDRPDLRAQVESLIRRDVAGDLELYCEQNPVIAADLMEICETWHETLATLGSGADPSQVLSRLERRAEGEPRYRIKSEVARGGMGAILEVWDDDVRRPLAMKVILSTGKTGNTCDADRLSRFLEEAQVTGQLDHPGVVPVHEIGIDNDGKVFFTMKLVKGRDLREIFDMVKSGEEDWSVTRALGVLLKVCEAMSYAHAKGVIHRDLKPGNVMVGKFGEVYVMDWGLARVLGRKDTRDLRLKNAAPQTVTSVKTDRREEREATPDTPLVTMDGTVVGTPAYMPPEQARGEVEKLDARSDVYAVGAMLYHLLAGRMPYVPEGAAVSGRTILQWVMDGPPKPLRRIMTSVPPELEAICERAMARPMANRYPTILEFASDLQAYLEDRVVQAYASGPLEELKKWIKRNKATAASLAAAALLLVAGSLGVAYVQREGRNAAQTERDAKQAALTRLVEVNEELTVARDDARQSASAARRQSYVANFLAADISLTAGDARKAALRLERCPEEFRHWEWHHLKLRSDTSVSVTPGSMVAFSPDGNRWVLGYSDGAARVFDVGGEESLLSLEGHTAALSALSYLPDGRIVTASRDGTMRVWDGSSGEQLHCLEIGEGVWSHATSRDGSVLAVAIPAHKKSQIHIWETDTFRKQTVLDDGLAKFPIALDSPGRRLATTSERGGLRVYDVATGDLLFATRVPTPWNEMFGSVAFHPDDSVIATCGYFSYEGRMRFWDSDTGKIMREVAGPQFGVSELVYGPRGRVIAATCSVNTIGLFDGRTLEPLAALRGSTRTPRSPVFHPEGRFLATSAWGKTRLYDTLVCEAWDTLTTDFWGDLAFSPDGTLLALTTRDELRLFDVRTGDLTCTLGGGRKVGGPSPDDVVFDPRGRWIAAGMDDGSIWQWDLQTGRVLRIIEAHEDEVTCLSVGQQGTLLASGSKDGSVRVWDSETGQPRGNVKSHEAEVLAVALDTSGRFCASSSRDRNLRVWDLRESREFDTPLRGTLVFGLAFHPSQPKLAAGTLETLVRIFDLDQKNVVQLQGHEDVVLCVEFSPDGRRLVSGDQDGVVRIWDVDSREEVLALREFQEKVPAIAVSPDGERIAAASFSGPLRIWNSSPAASRSGPWGDAAELRIRAEAFVNRLLEEADDNRGLALRRLKSIDGLDDTLRQTGVRMLEAMIPVPGSGGLKVPVPEEVADSTDPLERQEFADALAEAGDFEAALRECLWCFDEGVHQDRNYARLRVPHLLGQMIELADSYPPVLEALSARRERAASDLLEGRGDTRTAWNVVLLDERLLQVDRTVQLYDELVRAGSVQPDVLEYLWGALAREFLRVRQYDTILRNMRDFETEMTRRSKKLLPKAVVEKMTKRQRVMVDEDRYQLVNDGGMYYEALLGTNQLDAAATMAERLLEVGDSAYTFSKLVLHARSAGVPDVAEAFVKRARETLTEEQREGFEQIIRLKD